MPKNYRINDLFLYYTVDPSGCWIWRGSIGSEGYGLNRRDGKTVRMHRAFYEHFKGEIPGAMQVCHTCDVRRCVNPDHLFLGTNKENADDRDRKGRWVPPPCGDQNCQAKLTWEQVHEARRLWKCGASARGLARQYGVNHRTMLRALKKIGWVKGDPYEQQ